MSMVARILDANANRAREAMRVMEDAARFALNDASLCESLKTLRHDLRKALDGLPPGWLEANRATPDDVGTSLSTEPERHRTNLVEVVIAAGKRLSESLRVIEETGKTLNITFSSQIESIRYRAYDLESRLQMLLGTGRARQWRLCLLLTESLCRLNWRDVVERALENGADCIQVREKNMETRALTDRVREVVSLAHPEGASVIVNDRADVALIAGADGVHVGQHDLTVAQVRRLAGRSLLVGVSTHDLDEASAAVQAGADYCGVGAMFPSSLKPERTPSGPTYLQRFIETYPDVPHLAIGGIDQGNIAQLVEAGCRGVAVSSAICAADDPKTITQQLREALQAVEAPS